MLIKTLLERAASCRTQGDVEALLAVMKAEFFEKGPLKQFSPSWQGGSLADGDPFFGVDGAKDIANGYVLEIRPEIRKGHVFVRVLLMNKASGTNLCDEVSPYRDDTNEDTVAKLCELIKKKAIALHQDLIESVGVPKHEAARIASDCF